MVVVKGKNVAGHGRGQKGKPAPKGGTKTGHKSAKRSIA
jgi:hypothetical protein